MTTEAARVEATIARLRAKRDAATDQESRRYYELCIAGWQRELVRLENDNANHNQTGR